MVAETNRTCFFLSSEHGRSPKVVDTQVFCEKLNESLAWKRDQPGRLGMDQTLSWPNEHLHTTWEFHQALLPEIGFEVLSWYDWHLNLTLTNDRFRSQCSIYRGIHKWRYPKWVVYFMDNPIKMDDLGVPPFQETTICFSDLSPVSHLFLCQIRPSPWPRSCALSWSWAVVPWSARKPRRRLENFTIIIICIYIIL
jgi:hypothetical protein